MSERLKDPDGRQLRILVHKNPSTVGIEEFPKFFPSGRLLFLVRDGRDVVNSLLSAEKITKRWSARRSCLLYRHAKTWVERVERVENYPGSALTVQYKQLYEDPVTTLQEIAAFVGLDADPAWLERATPSRSADRTSSAATANARRREPTGATTRRPSRSDRSAVGPRPGPGWTG